MISLKNIKEMILLSFPIIMGQLGLMLIGAGDIYIASKYSTNSVAAIGIANGLTNPIFLFSLGLTMGISPSLAALRGAGNTTHKELSSLIIYAFIIGSALGALALIWNLFIPYIGIEEKLVPSIVSYNNIVAFSFPFATMFAAIKEYLQSREEVFFPNLIAVIAVFINLGLNYILVFGLNDYEGMGEIGLALASLSIRIFLFAALFFYILPKETFTKFDINVFKSTFKFGLPIASMMLFEVSAFCLVGVLGGYINIVAAATNNIAMTLASTAFMIPMALSHAATVKVGNAYGAKDINRIKSNIWSALIICFSYIFISSAIFYLYPEQLMSLISDDPEVIKLGVGLLFIVALFQFVDGVQVVLNGILRGMKRVRFSSALVFIGFWVIGIPAGIYLCFYKAHGITGLWIGLAVALAVVAISLGTYLISQLKDKDIIFRDNY